MKLKKGMTFKYRLDNFYKNCIVKVLEVKQSMNTVVVKIVNTPKPKEAPIDTIFEEPISWFDLNNENHVYEYHSLENRNGANTSKS